ncbi:helix-turn-helix domain-containing protein [Streptomyces sp. NPDC058045]|uniref:helix-turn-helix domain-containing protein n=1 Tax=Streptomyces sp. NPDC058045 TaxID=3346311 RepID=UPI0036E6A95C
MADDGGEPGESESLKCFGAVLKALREQAGLTQEELATQTGYSTHYVAKFEQGKRYPPQRFIDQAGVILDAPHVLRAAARHLTRRRGLASWFQQWAGVEEDAVSLYAYECRVIPGLLQPEPYIRAAFASSLPPLPDEQLEGLVEARLDRQRILVEQQGVDFGFIIEQAVIERRTGGDEVTRDLIDHLLDRAHLRHVHLQIMPLRQPNHAGLDGPLYLAETSDNEWFGYFEGQQSSALIRSSKDISALQQRYGMMRSQALAEDATVSLLREMRGAL